MSIIKLTEKEKNIFYNIVKNPNLNDIELSKKTGIKRSTVTAIRNRLKREKYYQTIIIPNLPFLGVKLISVLYGKFNPKYPREERRKAGTFGSKLKHPELVFLQTTDTESFALYISKDFSEIRKAQDYFVLDYEAHDFLEEIDIVFYPIDLCNVYSFFDFSKTLSRLFDIKDEQLYQPIWKGKPNTTLTNTEKKIFHSIIKYPEANNIEISKKTGKTRSTVSKVRKTLLNKGIISVLNVPALEKLGCELMISYYSKFNPKSTLDSRKDGIELTLKKVTPIVEISGDMEASGLFIFRNYSEYVEVYNKITSYYKEKDYLKENPHVLFFPFQQLKWTKLDFASITEKLLFNKD